MRRSWLWLAVAGLLALAAFAALAPERARFVAGRIASLGATAEDLPAAIDKANLYVDLVKITERALDSWERYLSWVDLKTGPTGEERYVSYGLYDLHDASAVIGAAREASRSAAAKIDAAVLKYIESYEALAPLLKQASAYYERRDYLADRMAGGKALHAAMVPFAEAFVRERAALEPDLRAHMRDIARRELAAVEKREGRSRTWRAGQAMAAANRVMDLFPRERPVPMDDRTFEEMLKGVGPDTPGETLDAIISGARAPSPAAIDMAKFDEALAAFGRSVDDVEAFAKDNPDGLAAFREASRQLRDRLKEFREPLARHAGRGFPDAGRHMSWIYRAYFDLLSESSRLAVSRLQFLY